MATDVSSNYELYKSLGLTNKASTSTDSKKKEMGMDTFMELMVTQMTHQDPMKPMESGDFLGQIAQFSMVSGLQELNKSFATLSSSISSSQALQAGALVGKTVMTEGQYGTLTSDRGLEGELNLTSSAADLEVRIYDRSGALMKTMELGSQASGSLPFKWDGIKDDGSSAPAGVYRIEADALDENGRAALPTLVSSKVESVVVGNSSQGLMLNLAGLGSVPFNSVSKIQ